jgi:hypothetical protein
MSLFKPNLGLLLGDNNPVYPRQVKKITQPEDLSARRSVGQKISRPEDDPARRSVGQRMTQPEDQSVRG